MGKTTIEWADHSINPFKARNKKTGKVGHYCVKCSPGCKFCYSSGQQTPYLTGLPFNILNRPKLDLFLDENALDEVLHRRKPTKWFWVDMTDMFLEEEYPDAWIDRCFETMEAAPQHIHMVLTKRAERMARYTKARYADKRMPPNIWLGVSAEDQEMADERLPWLVETPARIRFGSVEPLLEPVSLDRWMDKLQWIIAGGESGWKKNARPCHVEWIRPLIASARVAKVSMFVKQLVRNAFEKGQRLGLKHKKGGDMTEWPEDLRVREWATI
jgi:protein gp37